jgi:hypothetical protein
MATLLIVSDFNSYFYREAREAKRGGTAPGESRVHKAGAGSGIPFELNKIYAVNPRIQKINIASPNIKASGGSVAGIGGMVGAGSGTIASIQNESVTLTKGNKDMNSGVKPRIKFNQHLGLNRNEPIK